MEWIHDRNRLGVISDTLNRSTAFNTQLTVSPNGDYLECRVQLVEGAKVVKIAVAENADTIELHLPGKKVACIPKAGLVSPGAVC